MRHFIGIILLAIAVLGGLWIGIVWGIIQPIFTITDAIDADTVTAGLIGGEVLKFFLKEFLAAIWVWIFMGAAMIIGR